jgi:hypothetical protein
VWQPPGCELPEGRPVPNAQLGRAAARALDAAGLALVGAAVDCLRLLARDHDRGSASHGRSPTSAQGKARCL